MQLARAPRRGVNRWKKEEIVLQSEIASLMNNADKQDQLVVDSGTALHMHRDKHAFETISNASVSIRGVSGVGKGYKGILKQNKIGTGVPAIWYEDLPVQMLISTEGLKRDNWETHFLVSGDKIVNRLSGAILPIEKGPSGLPIIVNLFSSTTLTKNFNASSNE